MGDNLNLSLLTQLRDIHLPVAKKGWELAPGWYVLIVMGACILVTAVYFFWRRYQINQIKREALCLLARYRNTYQAEKNEQQFSVQVSELLKRVALAYFPRHKVAGLYGRAWITFLNNSGKKIDFTPVSSYLLLGPYQPRALGNQSENSTNVQDLYVCAEAWIKQRGKHV